ncbi:uncharacterized protein RHOBADRAFT_65998, partial [Rhodotorula graminis WP1]
TTLLYTSTLQHDPDQGRPPDRRRLGARHCGLRRRALDRERRERKRDGDAAGWRQRRPRRARKPAAARGSVPEAGQARAGSADRQRRRRRRGPEEPPGVRRALA